MRRVVGAEDALSECVEKRQKCWVGCTDCMAMSRNALDPWNWQTLPPGSGSSDDKAFLWSKYKCWQWTQVGVFRNNWPVCAGLTTALPPCTHSLKLFPYRHFLPRPVSSSPCAVCYECAEVPGWWISQWGSITQATWLQLFYTCVCKSVLSSYPCYRWAG